MASMQHNSNSGSGDRTGGGGAGGGNSGSGGNEASDNMRMVLHEGPLRVRQGNKWKSRWCVLSLSSPVSDKLRFTFKKEIKRQRDRKAAEYKEKFFFDCVDYCGMIPELRIDSCQHAMCVVFAKKMLTLGFETKYTQTDWECRIRGVYGEENLFTFSVQIPSNSPSGGILSRMHRSSTNAMMFIFNDNIAFVTMPDDDVPQKLASMKLSSVESYGADAKTRSIMLKLKKKAYRFESHMPQAILKALDHVSGRRLLHETEGSVSEDIHSELELADYGQAVSDLFLQSSPGGGGGGVAAGDFTPGGLPSPVVGGNALSHNNLLSKIATNPPISGMSHPTIDVNDCPFDDDGTLDMNTTVSERTHHYTMSPRQSMASQHLQERSMLSLDDKNSLATNTISSNNSNNLPVFNQQQNNGANMMPDFYHRDSPTPTYGGYISNNNSTTGAFNFRQHSPSNASSNLYNLYGHQDDAATASSVQIALNVNGGSSTQQQSATTATTGLVDLVPPPVPKRMSALYRHQRDPVTTSRDPAAVPLPRGTDMSIPRDFNPPPRLPPTGPGSRGANYTPGHQLFAASTPLDNSSTLDDPFPPEWGPLGVNSAVTPVVPPPPHSFMHRPPPSVPPNSAHAHPYVHGGSSNYHQVPAPPRKPQYQFVSRPDTANFFCGSCGLRRWISCPDICISSFAFVTHNPFRLSSPKGDGGTVLNSPTSPLQMGNSPLVQSVQKAACTVSKCRNQQLAEQLSGLSAALCFRHLAFLKLPWVRRANSEVDCHALSSRVALRISLGSSSRQHKHHASTRPVKQTNRAAKTAEVDNFNNLHPYATNVSNGFSEENVAFSGSGSIEIEDSSVGLDGVSVMISGHSRDSVTAVSTPSYDWECRLESSRNSNQGNVHNKSGKPCSVKNKSSSRAEYNKQDAPHKQAAFTQRPGTAPNMFVNDTPNITSASFYDTNLSSGSERVSANHNNTGMSNNSACSSSIPKQQASGATPIGAKQQPQQQTMTTSLHNPFSLQLKHQTTLDPQGNVQNHLYINLDYPHTQPHSIVTSTPTASEAASGASAAATTTPSTGQTSHFGRGATNAPTQDPSFSMSPAEFQQLHHSYSISNNRSQQQAAPFKPPSGARSSFADSSVQGVNVKGHQPQQKPPPVKRGGTGLSGKSEHSSSASVKSGSQSAAAGLQNSSSNYSQLSNFTNVLSSCSRNNHHPSSLGVLPPPPHKNMGDSADRFKKSSLTDLYQNLEYPPSTSSPPSTTGAGHKHRHNDVTDPFLTELFPNSSLEGALHSHGPIGTAAAASHELLNVTSSSATRSNADDVERRRRRAKHDHSKATNAAVNRWIDNAVELSNYSRDNSPDTFIATAASISDSRDDVFLTDSEQQQPSATPHSSSNLQSRIIPPNKNMPPNPPPRQKTHNYHNIDPDLNIKSQHCPDVELAFKNASHNIPSSGATDMHVVETGTTHKVNSHWQNVTPSRKPPGAGARGPAAVSKWAVPSPKKVSSTKPPLSASGQRSFHFQNSEVPLRKSSDNTYRSINSSLNNNVSDSGINLGFDDGCGYKPNDSDLSLGPPQRPGAGELSLSQRDFSSISSASVPLALPLPPGATNIYQHSKAAAAASSTTANVIPQLQSTGGFHQHSSSNATTTVSAMGSVGLGSATPPIPPMSAACNWSHNISANRRSHSESRKPPTVSSSKASASALPPALQHLFSSAGAQGSNRPIGGGGAGHPPSTNQVVNYSVMDDNWAKLGANHSSSQKSHQVTKAEKALVQYSQVDEQLTKALHEAAIQHENDRMNFRDARRKSSGRSSHLSRTTQVGGERHSSFSGGGGGERGATGGTAAAAAANQSRAASAAGTGAASASHR